MKLIQDTSFKGIRNEYTRLNKQYRSTDNNRPGFMHKTYEKALKRSVNYLRKKTSSMGNLNSLQDLAFKSKGDINKVDPKVKSILDSNYKMCKDLMKEFNSQNITEGSILRMYVDTYELLSDTKVKQVFAKAVEYERKINNGPQKTNLVGLLAIMYILYIVLIFFLIFVCVAALIDICSFTARARESRNLDQKMFETIVSTITGNNRAMMLQLGFTAINALFYIKSFPDLNKAVSEGVAREQEARNKVKKGREDGYIDFYDVKDTGVSLVNNSGKTMGKESAILIVALSLLGVVLVVSLVRRSIYWIGALKIDIIKLLYVEAETLRINIEELEKKRDNTKNESERKKLTQIIEKQKAIHEKLRTKLEATVRDSNEAFHESEDQVNVEDKENENSSSSDDDYEVIL